MTQDHHAVPQSLLDSPSFQIERLRRRTREEVDHALSKNGTNIREYWVLSCLIAQNATSQSLLSELLAIDASDMVRLIDALERQGWATRKRDPSDRRRQIVAATTLGKEACQNLDKIVRDAENIALDISTNTQLKHLRRLATAILAAEQEEN